jgi:hypothetical protein
MSEAASGTGIARATVCAAHPDIGLITATDKLFQKE